MKANWDLCFELVLKSEGGFSDNPKDPGGMTNLGVTKRNWERYLDRNVSESEMRALTPEVVKPFYKTQYWDKIKGDDLPSGIDYAAYDLAVNSGVNRASKWLQKIAGANVDGIIGPKSLEAINSCDAEEVIDVLCDMRMDFLKELPTFETFGRGWIDRVEGVMFKARNMA